MKQTGIGLAVLTVSGPAMLGCAAKPKSEEAEEEQAEAPIPYTGELKISLAQWSHHKEYQSGALDPVDFAGVARGYGIDTIEYVNQFYKGKAEDKAYLDALNARARDNGVYQHLIMIDGEGEMANPDDAIRSQTILNHHKWVDAAAYLGCKSIRVNVFGDGSAEVVQAAAVDSLGRLAEYAKERNLNIIVENHGGFSSHGGWLSGVIRQVNLPNVGTLPDFGNFCLKKDSTGTCIDEYDRYVGIEQLMPFAKAVSAKSHKFESHGEETTIDYKRMLDLVKAANYSGYIGIEYEGDIPAEEGILATKRLLEKYI